MAKLTQFGKNNLLWRRVQRHAQMSAIFAPPMSRQTAVSPSTPPATWDIDVIEPPIQSRPTIADENLPQSSSAVPVFPKTAVSQMPTKPVATAKPALAATHVGNLTSHAVDEGEDKNWRRLQTIRRRYQQKKAAEEMAPPSSESIQRQPNEPVASSPSLPSDGAETAVTPESSTVAPKPAPHRHATPLEAVWSVQKKEPSPTAVEQRSTKQPRVQRQPLPAKQAQQIDRNLAEVAPGRETESPIETILPTRPRPQTSAPIAVQRREEREAALPNLPTSTQDNTASPTPLVPTEIGPLPADLWETLGLSPPQPPAMASTPLPTSPALPEAVPDLPKTAVSPPEPNPPQPAPQRNPAVAQITAVPIEPNLPTQTGRENVQTAVSHALPSTKTQATMVQRSPEVPSGVQGVMELGEMSEMSETAVPQPTTQLTTKPVVQRIAETAVATIAVPPSPQTAPKTVRNAQAIHPTSQQGYVVAVDVAQQTIPQGIQPPKVQPKPAESEVRIQRFPTMPGGIASAVQDVAAQGMGVMETAVHAPAALLQEAEQAIETAVYPEETAVHPEKEGIDIDELSRQVYQSLKRKLAVEWERGYGR